MSRKRDIGHDGIQEEILRKLEDSSTQRQIDIGGGVMVNITQEDYGKFNLQSFTCTLLKFTVLCVLLCKLNNFKHNILLFKKDCCSYLIYLCVWVVTYTQL